MTAPRPTRIVSIAIFLCAIATIAVIAGRPVLALFASILCAACALTALRHLVTREQQDDEA